LLRTEYSGIFINLFFPSLAGSRKGFLTTIHHENQLELQEVKHEHGSP
jgi:hypothetical protein